MFRHSIFSAILLGAAATLPAQHVDLAPGPDALAVRPVPEPHHRPLHVDIWTDSDAYYIGDSIDVGFRVSRDAHVYIFNTDTLGRRTQIFPNYFDQDNFVIGGVTQRIPRRGYDLEVTGPVGHETLEIYAVADSRPYLEIFHDFDRRRPFQPLNAEGERALRQLTPGAEHEMLVETHGVEINFEDHRRSRATAITHFEVHDIRRPPVPYGGDLIIRTRPRYVGIYIDGVFSGYAPGIVENVAPGWHDIELYRPGYRPHRERICIEPGLDIHLNVTLTQGYRRHSYHRPGFRGRFHSSVSNGEPGASWFVNVGAVSTNRPRLR
jgi:hypothetical protein